MSTREDSETGNPPAEGSGAPPVPPGAPPMAEGPVDAASTTGASVIAGTTWTMAQYVLPQLYVVVQSVVAARFLTPGDMGRQSFIAFVELSLLTVFTGGLPTATARKIAELLGQGNTGAVRVLLRWAWRVEAVASALAAGAFVLLTFGSADHHSAWALAGVACIAGILHAVPSAALFGMQRWRDAALVGLGSGTLGLVGSIAVLAAGAGIPGLFAVEAVVGLLGMAAAAAIAKRCVDGLPAKPPVEMREVQRSVVRYASVATVSLLINLVVWKRSEFLFLERYSGDVQIALYSVAFGAVAALVYLPQAIVSVMVPAIASLFGAGADERIRSGFGRAIRLLALMSLPLTAGALSVGPAALRLIYGEAYRGTGSVLLILMAAFPLIPLINTSLGLLWGTGKLRFPTTVLIAAAAVNIGLDVLLIPDHGAVGAAWANVGAQLFAGVPVIVYAARQVGPLDIDGWALVRGAAAAVATGLVALAVMELVGGLMGLALAVVAGVVAFAAAALVLRVVPARDAQWLGAATGPSLMATLCRASARAGAAS